VLKRSANGHVQIDGIIALCMALAAMPTEPRRRG
jgi:hypothetical protein